MVRIFKSSVNRAEMKDCLTFSPPLFVTYGSPLLPRRIFHAEPLTSHGRDTSRHSFMRNTRKQQRHIFHAYRRLILDQSERSSMSIF
ncbi:unnamed protein product [Periconia digitata]|uniref:Uncharacterized protein n=1 Tax=Periconia digitata TaxID=1303443 RepID=A0A9W4UNI1_9PLEO|nr:unnamed protein product [Periconia digitata]